MYLVGNGASAAHNVAAPNQSALNHCLLPTSLKSFFDVADMSALMKVKMDRTVQDYKENTSTGGRKSEWRIRVTFKRTYFSQILQWILQA